VRRWLIPRLPVLIIGGVFFLALAVRYYHLGEAPIWGDEIFSWAVAHLRPSLLISYLYQGNNPPLWELLLSGWLRLTLDDSPFGLRFLPATFSALTALGLYYLGRETGGISAGILAALLWVFSRFGQGVCREARAYGLLAFLSAISFLFFARYLKTQKSSYFWAWLVASIFLMHTHYSSFFIPLFQMLWLGFCFRQKALPALIRFGALLVLSLGPAALVFADRASSYHATGYASRFSPESLYNILWTFSNMPVPTVLALSVWGLSMMLFIGRWRFLSHFRVSAPPPLIRLPLLGFPLLIGLIVIVGWSQPLWQAQYFVPLAIFYFWAVGSAVSLWQAPIGAFFMGGLVAAWAITFHLTPRPPDPSLPQIAHVISQKPPRQLLIVSPSFMLPTLAYTLRERLFAGVPFPDLHPEPLERLSHELRIQLRLYGATRYSDLPACEILAQDTLFWLDMEVCFSDPHNLLEDLLMEDFTPIAIQRLEKATLTTYRRRANPQPN